MKVGISTSSFFNKAPTEACFDILRGFRVEAAEVFLNTYSEYEKPFVEALLQRKGALNIHSVHALSTQFEPELFNQNPRVSGDAEAVFRKVCYAAHTLGAKYYTFHGPLCLKKRPYVFNFERLGARLNQLIDIAEGYGVRLSYENVHYSYNSTPVYFEKLKAYCPKLMATLDIKQALQAGEDAYRFMDAMEGRISTIHVCDMVKNETCLPGKGKINFEKLIRELYRRDIGAPLIIEVYPADYDDNKEVRESYEYLAGIRDSVNG